MLRRLLAYALYEVLSSRSAQLSSLVILPCTCAHAPELRPHVQVYGLSGPVARYIGRNGPILHRFANEDVTLGAWLVGLEVTHVDERRFCCDSAERCMAQARSRPAHAPPGSSSRSSFVPVCACAFCRTSLLLACTL